MKTMEHSIRILLVEDVVMDAELVQREIRKAGILFLPLRVDTRNDFLHQLHEFAPDIILADYSLPQLTALDALRMLKKEQLDIPFILVTGAQSEEVAVECMKEGADDYILKTSLTRLPNVILNAIKKKEAERDRAKAETALIESEQMFRALIENALDIITFFSEEGLFRFASPSMKRVLGYDPADLLNTSAFNLVHPDDLENFRISFAHVLNHPGSHQAIEFRFRHKDGSWRTLESIASLLQNHPSVSGVVINSRDITPRKKVENQKSAFSQLGQRLSGARTAEESARMIVEIADQLFGWDSCSLDLYFQDQETVAPVLTMDVMNGKRVDVPAVYRTRTPNPLARRTLEQGAQLVLQGSTEPDVAVENFGDRSRVSESLMFVPIRHGDQPIGVISIRSYSPNAYSEEDLSVLQSLADHCGGALARIRAGKALRDSEERYRIMTEQTGQLVYDYDVESGRILWSGAIKEITGYDPEEFYGFMISDWEDHIHPDDQKLAALLLEEAMQSGDQYNVEYRLRRENDSYVYVEDNGIFVRNELGQSVRMLGTMKDITERKKAQEALRQSEERFRRLAENAQDIIFRYRLFPSPAHEYMSPVVTAITGYTPEEFYNDPNLGQKIVHPDDLSKIDDASHSAGFTGPAILRWIRKDGTVIWVEQRSVPIYDGAGNTIAVEGIARDITERKRSEEALRESEERYRVVAETASDGFVTVNSRGTILFANTATEKIFGRAVATLLGQSVDTLMPTFLAYVENAGDRKKTGRMRKGEPIELSGMHSDGNDIPLEFSFSTFTKNGEQFVTAIVRDVTERMKSQEALRISEERYRDFFEDDLTGDYITKMDGTIVACNPAFARIFGFSSVEEALSTNADQLYPTPESRNEVIALLTRDKKLEYYEHELRRKDGKSVYVVQNAIGQFDDKGNLTEIKGYLFDNTERMLLQDQLYQAEKMDSIGKLASGIAHDFNNIMNNILGFTTQLKKHTGDQAKVIKYGDTIERSATRGAELANQLLSFVRHKKRENVPTLLGEIVDEVQTLCSQTFPKNISIEKSVNASLLPLMGDKGELYQVLLNLCMNARDAMPDGGVLSIQAENRVVGKDVSTKLISGSAKKCIEVTVHDTGMGIPEHVRDKIFDPFFTTKEKGKGTGLGLSIVFGIVRNHKGSIFASSDVGKGTTFSIYLPAIQQGTNGEEDNSPETQQQGKNELVLLVDDEESAQELGREILQENGYRVLIAGDGELGLELYKQYKSDIALVILDLMMPKLDGGQTFIELKKINPDVKAFFCSGHASSEVIGQLLAEENLRALSKPFEIDDFVRTVREVLDED